MKIYSPTGTLLRDADVYAWRRAFVNDRWVVFGELPNLVTTTQLKALRDAADLSLETLDLLTGTKP